MKRRSSSAVTAALFTANPLPMWIVDPETDRVVDANDAALQRYGLDEAEFRDLRIHDLAAPSDRDRLAEWLQTGDGSSIELAQQAADGGTFPAEVRATAMRRGARRLRLIVVRDVSGRRRVEEQLRQSQKMEAVGRLAGAIAHDFNNVLTAIGGYADLLLSSLDEGDERREDVAEIRRATERGSRLTRQLLAFSRRQAVTSTVVDLNGMVEGMRPMLERLLGADVRLVLGLDPASGGVRVDDGQLEQVLLNLALNGRDAMASGGQLLIETAPVELDERWAERRPGVSPGRYAMLGVSDEGIGLSEEARSHLFEPFFTTKPRGKGTGLGLATVYGIVRQAGGHIDVFSRPELGTTFRVYLPRVHETADSNRPHATDPVQPDRLHGQVLVAEDDAAVRRVVVESLERAGLTVLAAEDGAAAIELLGEMGPPDLLLTDVDMPRMTGPELVRTALARHPGLRVLYMSGHPSDDTNGRLGRDGHTFVQKPFATEDLVDTVRRVLAAPAPRGARSRH